MPSRSETNGGRSLGGRRGQTAQEAPVLELEHAELRERGLQRELVAVAAVDPGHERLDERFVRLPPETARHERRNRLVLVAASGGHVGLGREARFPLRRQQLALVERVEARGDHPGEALRERVQVRRRDARRSA